MCATPTALRHANREQVIRATMPACFTNKRAVPYARSNSTRKGRKSKKKENKMEGNVAVHMYVPLEEEPGPDH